MKTTAGFNQAEWAFAEHEHHDLRRGLDRIHDVACGIEGWIAPELSIHLLGVVDWFDHVLAPHADWEQSWLYPQIDERAGTPWATRSARYDHAQLRALRDRISEDQHRLRGGAGRELLPDVRCHLFSLEAELRSHIEREERFLIPVLVD